MYGRLGSPGYKQIITATRRDLAFLSSSHGLVDRLPVQTAIVRVSGQHGIDNRLIEPGHRPGSTINSIECFQRLGGMLRFYYRNAA